MQKIPKRDANSSNTKQLSNSEPRAETILQGYFKLFKRVAGRQKYRQSVYQGLSR